MNDKYESEGPAAVRTDFLVPPTDLCVRLRRGRRLPRPCFLGDLFAFKRRRRLAYWRDCHSAAPPSTFSGCFNRDGEGDVSKMTQSRQWPVTASWRWTVTASSITKLCPLSHTTRGD